MIGRTRRGALAAVLAVDMACGAHAAVAQSRPAPAAPASAPADMRPLVIGVGAVAGVVAFNVLALGVEALPGGLAYGADAVVPAEMSVAMSRVYATTSAVIGGWIAYYGFAR
jgi:hypothetical protein